MSTSNSNMPETRHSIIDNLGGPGTNPTAVAKKNRAWDRFFEIYSPVIYRFSRRAGLHESEADEVLSRVMRNFLTAFLNGLVIIDSKGRFRQYLRTVTNREIRKVLSKRPRGEDPEGPEPVAKPQSWEDDELRSKLEACLKRLRELGISERDITIFEDLVLRQQSPDALAKKHGVSVERVYGIKHEMIKRVRKLYKKLCDIMGADKI